MNASKSPERRISTSNPISNNLIHKGRKGIGVLQQEHDRITIPATRAGKAPVPVAAVATKLEECRELCGSPLTRWMFANPIGNPCCLDGLAREVIRPAKGNGRN
jgi:hypothetical protein